MESMEIAPAAGPIRGSIRPPGSKSITNRALVCAALAHGDSVLRGALGSEDTRVMIAALVELGIRIAVDDRGQTLRVAGCGGLIPAPEAELFVGNSGTTMRFLTALAALGRGDYRLDGVPRMRERPMGDQAAAMRALGVDVACEGANECPPVVVRGSGALRGGRASVRGSASSQFLSGLMMAAPYAEQEVQLVVEGALVSVPYVAMTARVMEAFGADVSATPEDGELSISNRRRYRGLEYAIEPDASAASYFFAAAAITEGEVTVEGLSRDSLQGDVAFVECLERMGAEVAFGKDSITVVGRPLTGIAVDMNSVSDTVPTLAVVGLFATGPTHIRNVAHIRHKETDRIAAVATELRKLGAGVEEFPDGLRITPNAMSGATIATYDDHRMAMSFALAGLRVPGVVINDPGCTAKTYPGFFEDLERLVRGGR
jgi:3-phosphoshikimate 1-carboxyvinyltransferase